MDKTTHWSIRYWDSIEKSEDPDGCWIWTGSLKNKRHTNEGYGYLTIDEVPEYAHRLALLLDTGTMPAKGLVTRHRCPGRPDSRCCNPAHLSVGTQSENMRDAHDDGALPRTLTPEAVRDIRARYNAGGITQRELGLEYGVAQSAISYAIRGINWAHVA